VTHPYPFQVEGIRAIVRRFGGRALLADDPGLGKSFQSIRASQRLAPDDAVVVVCPASIKENWRREWRKHAGVRACVLHGMRPKYAALPPCTDGVYVVNYDVLQDVLVERDGKAPRRMRGWKDALKALRPKLVIVDEITAIKNQNTKRARAVKHLCDGVPYALGLGGTAGMKNRPIELYSWLSVCRPDVFDSRMEFGLEYCGARQVYGRWDFSGATRMRKLNRLLLSTCMVRRRKQDVLKDLPPETRTVVPIELSKKARAEYGRAVDDYLGWLHKVGGQAAVRGALKAEELHKLGHLIRLTGRLKLPGVIDWVSTFLREAKLLLFGIHKKDFLYPLHDRFRGRAVLVTGSTPQRKRQPLFDAFNDDPRVELLVGNIDAAGYGWNCTATSYVFFGQMAWAPDAHSQARDRVHGIGRGTGAPVNSYWAVADGTVDEDLCRVIQRKQGNIATILDGKKSDTGVYDQFREAVLRRHG
jgi:SWI/SNF-related matrix-associated actin-dependent regulator of chromatin subfamily A-like protein 1